jgi:hypothetical protein
MFFSICNIKYIICFYVFMFSGMLQCVERKQVMEHSHISFVFVIHNHKFVICDLRPLRCGNTKWHQKNATGKDVPSPKNATGKDVPSWPHFEYNMMFAWALCLLLFKLHKGCESAVANNTRHSRYRKE